MRTPEPKTRIDDVRDFINAFVYDLPYNELPTKLQAADVLHTCIRFMQEYVSDPHLDELEEATLDLFKEIWNAKEARDDV